MDHARNGRDFVMCEAENPEGETHLLDMLVLWTQICDSKLDEKRCQIHHLTAVVVQESSSFDCSDVICGDAASEERATTFQLLVV